MSIPDYPRTLHLGDSGGRASRHSCSFAELASASHELVVEEKVDGSHCGLFFDEQAELRIFTRHTILESPPLRRDFRRLDQLATEELDELWEVLGTRYVLYGEWAHHTHTVFYDALPSFFLEDDIFDREQGLFLSTARRLPLVERLPPAFRSSVPVLYRGQLRDIAQLHALVAASAYKSADWRERCPDLAAVEDCDEMEGLYIKHEHEDGVVGRFKWVRPEFLAYIAAAGQHWRDRPELHNELATS